MKNNILIRVDGGISIGLGHLVRCISLAHILKNDFNISFFAKDIPDSVRTDLLEKYFEVTLIEKEEDFLQFVNQKSIIVIDGYHFSTNYQKQIKDTGAKLVCIDDLHDKEFFADIIINYIPGISSLNYKAQPYTMFALGVNYALLRGVFFNQPFRVSPKRKEENVLICFGGSDSKNLTRETSEIVSGCDRYNEIIIITGSSYTQSESLEAIKERDPRITHLHSINEYELSQNMLKAGIAIVSASGILLESICCGCLPLICYSEENQRELHNYMIEKIGINSFGDNSVYFQKGIFTRELSQIIFEENRKLEIFRRSIGSSSGRLVELFHSLI